MRRSATAHNPGVSLFPFLAVLICTMGVMMLLLVIINRPGSGASLDDSEASVEQPPGTTEATVDALNQARDMLAWKISQLESSREQTEGDLSDRRLRLSAIEDHMRKLRDQWQGMQHAVDDLEQSGQAKGQARQSTAAQIAKMREEILLTRARVTQAAERRSREAPSFAIIPYDGPNGTRRRPIYIECGPDSVVLQPEGITLPASDFEGPDGPGNPLASTLRAARDFIAAQNAATGTQGEPYPLLIVRPNGIVGFYAARAAMASWASEFGYELVEQDQIVSYPAASPQLAQVEQTALADARSRYTWFAQTRTGRKQSAAPRTVYHASVNGGGVVQEGSALAGDTEESSAGFGGGTASNGAGSSPAGGGGSPVTASRSGSNLVGSTGSAGVEFAANGPRGDDHLGFGNPYADGPGSASGAAGAASSRAAAGNGGPGRYAASPGGYASQGTSGGFSAEKSQGSGGAASSGAAPSGAGQANVAYGQTNAYGNGSGEPAAQLAGGQSGSSNGAALAADGQSHGAGPGESGPGGSGVSASFNPNAGPSGASEASSSDHGPAFQPGLGEFVDRPNIQPAKKADEDDAAKKTHSLADKRGRNWSLPSNARTTTAVTRPIRVECRGDQMIIKPDAGNSDRQTVPFKGRTEDSVDPLVAAIWSHTKGWGLAGRQMYWHPVLVLEMGPSGEARFGELQALMADSGLEVRRK